MELLRNFQNLNKNDTDLAGGKGASLGEMLQAGIPVPPGFVILAETFEKFLEETDLNVEVDAVLHTVDHNAMHTVEAASEKIQTLIRNAQMPTDIAQEIEKFFMQLDAEFVAVRSSATAEDGAENAWAGQLDSYLNTTKENLLEKVQHCWASLFTPRAIFYRFEKNLHKQKISVAVVVQKMVASEISGIAFSVHPVTEDYNQLIIEAGFGLGESIVSGQITPDSYVVSKSKIQNNKSQTNLKQLEILDINIATQTRGLYRAKNGGNEWQEITESQASSQVLTQEQILELSELIIHIEKHYGFPCDIEWAFEDGKFYIVQSRPITTLTRVSDQGISKSSKSTPDSDVDPEFFIDKMENLEKANSKQIQEYHKLMNRSFPLIFFECWYQGERFGLSKISKGGMFFDPLFIYRKNRGADVLYNFTDRRQNPNLLVGYFEKNLKQMDLITKEQLVNYKHLMGILKNKKRCSLESIKEIFALSLEMLTVLTSMVVISNNSEENSRIVEISNQTRIKTEDFVFQSIDLLLKNAIELLPEEYKKFTYFLTYSEIVGELPTVQELEGREFGYIYYQGLVYANVDEKEFAQKHNLNIVYDKLVASSRIEEIRGKSAFQGKVTGKVKVVFEISDMKKIGVVDVLVTSMTTPDLIAVSRDFAAIVTDEGGMLCHAAIVARELKKPCIIGTKIATQVLHDGDLVEVDADGGIIKILNKKII